jgi:hypothetical protein
MCSFCENEQNKSYGNFDIQIVDGMLLVGNECSEGCGYERKEILINYCPFCGDIV